MSEFLKTEPGKAYFMTVTVEGWGDVFTRIEYKEEVVQSLKYCQEHKGLERYAWVVMTNHLHLIAKAGDADVGKVMWAFKSYSAKRMPDDIRSNPKESRRERMASTFEFLSRKRKKDSQATFWRTGIHPVELYSYDVICQKVNYIHENPVRAGIVTKPEHYLYSSAHPESPLTVLPIY